MANTDVTQTVFGESEYSELLRQAVAVLDQARSSVALQVNKTVSMAYWSLGRLLYERKLESSHGSGVIKRLSIDLKQRYPDLGTSPRNLWNMKLFYVRYSANSFSGSKIKR